MATAVFHRQRPGADRLIDGMAEAVIGAFCRSHTFDAARRRLEILRQVPDDAWTDGRRQRVLAALNENSQLRNGNLNDGRSIPSATWALLASRPDDAAT